MTGAIAILAILASSLGQAETVTARNVYESCSAVSPCLVTACYRAIRSGFSEDVYEPEAASVILVPSTDGGEGGLSLATYAQVGAVWGLGYRQTDHAVYAAAYHKRQMPFGPGGPGAVYRIDLATGNVSQFVSVPNVGPDRHGSLQTNDDRAAEKWVGRTSLGDLDLCSDESELFVVNLDDRRIYRFEMESGRFIGSFPHGAAGEPWAEEARPFGLACYEGYLYHGVVRTAEETQRRRDLSAHVYRSKPDGSEMTEVAAVALYDRRGYVLAQRGDHGYRADWLPWRDAIPGLGLSGISVYPMPMLTDIEFGGNGDLIIGLRDRRSDSAPHLRHSRLPEDTPIGVGFGDIMRGAADGWGWEFTPPEEHFDDQLRGIKNGSTIAWSDESILGGLARLPGGEAVLAGSYAYSMTLESAWMGLISAVRVLENESGETLSLEPACSPGRISGIETPRAIRTGNAPTIPPRETAPPMPT